MTPKRLQREQRAIRREHATGREYYKPVIKDPDYDIRDTDAFLAYAAEIRAMFDQYGSLTRPQIHNLLEEKGIKRNGYWTGMTLDLMHVKDTAMLGDCVLYELYVPAEPRPTVMGMQIHRARGDHSPEAQAAT